MGLSPFKISCSCYDHGLSKVIVKQVEIPNPLNPDPSNFLIERIEHSGMGNYLVVKVKYPNCPNYEGCKILVFNSLTLEQLMNAEVLDPHFSSEKPELSPIARFVPTNYGWNMAVQFAKDRAWEELDEISHRQNNEGS